MFSKYFNCKILHIDKRTSELSFPVIKRKSQKWCLHHFATKLFICTRITIVQSFNVIAASFNQLAKSSLAIA